MCHLHGQIPSSDATPTTRPVLLGAVTHGPFRIQQPDGRKHWISPDCRRQLVAAAMPVSVRPWDQISAFPDTPTPHCDSIRIAHTLERAGVSTSSDVTTTSDTDPCEKRRRPAFRSTSLEGLPSNAGEAHRRRNEPTFRITA